MALNRYMHPQNPYKNNRPDFKKLALEHEYFRKVAKQSLDGKVSIDFKNPECLRALSKALLQSDFGLDVDLPASRLVPAIPQRVNYLLWLDDVITQNSLSKNGSHVTCVDIGCGACCIYPLLGSKMKGWSFIATEKDDLNLKYANENVSRNKLTQSIRVVEADKDSLLRSVIEEADLTDPPVMFCMCNPPFFDSSTPSTDLPRSSRDGPRPEADHVSTASEVEREYEGGEVEFVRRMIDESLLLRDRVSFYTSLLGLKSSVGKLKSYLRQKSVNNISSTEMCQGRTMRWVIAWTFRDEITFPKSLFQQERSKEKSGFTHVIPSEIKCCQYDIVSLTQHIKGMLQTQLKMSLVTLNQDAAEYVSVVTAKSNTWSHNRRRRRQEQRLKRKLTSSSSSADGAGTDGEVCSPIKRIKLDESAGSSISTQNLLASSTSSTAGSLNTIEASSAGIDQPSGIRSSNVDSHTSKIADITGTASGGVCMNSGINTSDAVSGLVSASSGDDEDVDPLVTFSLEIRLDGVEIKLSVKLIDGEQKDMLHQILQYIKNRII